MKKIVFDNSIHLGQFSTTDESLRIACKNSQAMLSAKYDSTVIGIESFNENAYSDDIIWGLERLDQDTFYPFMDVYHSVKNVIRTPLSREDCEMALKIAKEFDIHPSNALTCAIAIREKAHEIHSVYSEFKNEHLQSFMKSFDITIYIPDATIEHSFDNGLEELYQNALKQFRDSKVDLPSQFHS